MNSSRLALTLPGANQGIVGPHLTPTLSEITLNETNFITGLVIYSSRLALIVTRINQRINSQGKSYEASFTATQSESKLKQT